ncbi:MAG: RsmB/NOP family class I SAM-dependent RNA methyltransferase [Ruminococcus sp.]|nr:RsmB/NOP family class I SAM-dependent RNA methyltransferase [Ruminococcus sp.]
MNEFFTKIKEILNDEFEDFLKCYNGDNFRGLRVNTLKISFEELKDIIGFELVNTPFCKSGAYIPNEIQSLGNSPLHHAGAFYIQEPSATSAVTMLNVQKGDKVLDLCAAPGGKSTQIAADLMGTGLLWSNEIVKNRANILLSNIERMGVKNAVVSSCHPDTLCNALNGFFDKVLVDAPCSGEGMFRKDSNALQEWSVEHVKSCAERQLQILNSAKNALKPDGVIVYSTCTFSKEENEQVIEKFLKQNPDFELEEPDVTFGRRTMDYAVRIFPMDGGEGHFAARLKRKNQGQAVYHLPVTANADRKTLENVNNLLSEFLTDPEQIKNITVIKDKIYSIPTDMPQTKGVQILRGGVLIGEIKKNRIEPEHHLFMTLNKNDFKQSVDLDVKSDEIIRFLHGEEIDISNDIKGYTPVCVNGITCGFGKASNGKLKNKYPKGLRIL